MSGNFVAARPVAETVFDSRPLRRVARSGQAIRTIVFYGNCQVSAICRAINEPLDAIGLRAVYVPSWHQQGGTERLLTPEERESCVLLFEQIDQKRYAHPDGLSGSCETVRFASLDTNLLWPFATANPYNDASEERLGGDLHGDRILLRYIEQDWSADAIIDYYCNSYDDYKVDLSRVAVLDAARRRARDAASDVPMAGLVEGLIAEPLFCSNRHPRASLLNKQLRLLMNAGARYLSELAVLDRDWSERELFPAGVPWSAIPIHPGVAADLALPWFDRKDTYRQVDGSSVTHDEYIRLFVHRTIEVRRSRKRSGGRASSTSGYSPPLDGPALAVDCVSGIYADGFAAPIARFFVTAVAAVERIVVEGFYPSQHRRAGTVGATIGQSSASVVVEPGTVFTLELDACLQAAQRVEFSVTCSATLNMFEQGLSDDDRDLGALILKIKTG